MKKAIALVGFILSCNAIDIAVTIDDHPMDSGLLFSTQERTNKFIEAGRKHGIKIAFFCVGKNCITNDQDSLLLLKQNGHFLANHTFNHDHLSEYSLLRFKKEIAATEQILHPYGVSKWFRYPFLDYGNREAIGGSPEKMHRAYELLKEMGYAEGYVSINTFDWHLESRLQTALRNKKKIAWDKLKRLYLSLIKEWCDYYIGVYKKHGLHIKHTLLLHANDINALYLDDILSMIKESGWRIISPDQVFKNTQWREDLIRNKSALLSNKPDSLDCTVIDSLIEKDAIFA